jgi:UDP-3-O-acyl-N-acetylglucosamine deacetylase
MSTSVTLELPMDCEDSNAEAMEKNENLTQNHRTDFTSELFKIEISNARKFGYGVSK